MKISSMIEAVVTTQDEAARPRLRAALQLGARIAIESLLTKNQYNSDAKNALDELDLTSKLVTEATEADTQIVA